MPIFGLFGPPDIEKMKARRDAKGLIKAMVVKKKDRDVNMEIAAYKALVEIKAVKPLINALKDVNSHERALYIDALGDIGDARAVEPLISVLLKDPDWRGRAACALGALGDKRAVEPLISVLMDLADDVRGNAAFALGEIGDARAVEPLISALKDADVNVRGETAKALGKIRDARAVEPLIASLKDPNDLVQGAAAVALGLLGNTRAVEPLITELKDQNNSMRRFAAYALADLDDRRVFEPLVTALNDPDKSVRKFAADALVKLGVDPLLRNLNHPDRNQRKFASDTLRRMGIDPECAALVVPEEWKYKEAAKMPGQMTTITGKPSVTAAQKGQIRAAALVCDIYLNFDSDEALIGFVKNILHAKWPRVELNPKAKIETVMGFSGSEAEAQTILKDLLQRSIDKVGLKQGQYSVEYFSVRSEMPPSRVQCLVAMPSKGM